MSTISITTTPVYLGVDIGKKSHAWCLLSGPLLKQRKTYHRCPGGSIKNERAEFERLLALVREQAGDKYIHVLCEHTGHYGYNLEQYLQEQPRIRLYRTQAAKRLGRDKTDRKDAQALAVKLYNQVSLRVQVTDEHERVTRLLSPIPTAAMLRPLVQHRIELVREAVRAENRLTSILDQLFPEFTEVYAQPNGPSALNLREKYPTAEAVAAAPTAALIATRVWTRPGNAAFEKLHALAKVSIGLKASPRRDSLVIEQAHLLEELRLNQRHQNELDSLIEVALKASREGQILLSFPGIGPVLAGQLLSGIGNIANFETVGKFRAYLGWAPRRTQSGTSFDNSSLDRGGNRLCKVALNRATVAALKISPRWRKLYQRLLITHTDKKGSAMGRVSGQIAGIIFLLLKEDAELVRAHQGDVLPAPKLYDVHHR